MGLIKWMVIFVRLNILMGLDIYVCCKGMTSLLFLPEWNIIWRTGGNLGRKLWVKGGQEKRKGSKVRERCTKYSVTPYCANKSLIKSSVFFFFFYKRGQVKVVSFKQSIQEFRHQNGVNRAEFYGQFCQFEWMEMTPHIPYAPRVKRGLDDNEDAQREGKTDSNVFSLK